MQFLRSLSPAKYFFLHAVARNVDLETLKDIMRGLAAEYNKRELEILDSNKKQLEILDGNKRELDTLDSKKRELEILESDKKELEIIDNEKEKTDK